MLELRNKRSESHQYKAWLQYNKITNSDYKASVNELFKNIIITNFNVIMQSALNELLKASESMLDKTLQVTDSLQSSGNIALIFSDDKEMLTKAGVQEDIQAITEEGYLLTSLNNNLGISVIAKSERGMLYGVFHLLRLVQTQSDLSELNLLENPVNELRMVNEWDNVDGSVERGYGGNSLFFEDNRFVRDWDRLKDYARLLSSTGLNGIAFNNVNVHETESKFITEEFLPDVAKVAEIFRAYGIKTYLSINYASPMELDDFDTADPLDENVRQWWIDKAKEIYQYIPDFGGVVVKADSENRPGPFTYGRNHADGANMLGKAFAPYGGLVLWRCFVYDCHQDWRDRSTDRARAAYDHFAPLDGDFMDNVILQIKNGPMDFQVREAVSPLFGAMTKTNQIIEFQIAQEYTGQQRHVCYLIPQWKEVLNFDTYAFGEGTPVHSITSNEHGKFKHSGITAVSNSGNDLDWTGHPLAQANVYGYGRLAWNPEESTEKITEEWILSTYGHDEKVVKTLTNILLTSWATYEEYTSPLGVGWMVNPDHHYGPNVDGYEYSAWGTYHFADWQGLGVDRTVATGTGYTSQYFKENMELFENVKTCPDELLLFFHHVPYTHQLHSGETVIQHIYNTHFSGVDKVEQYLRDWKSLENAVDRETFTRVLERLEHQVEHAKEWRDKINTYFYRKSGINDKLNRKIY